MCRHKTISRFPLFFRRGITGGRIIIYEFPPGVKKNEAAPGVRAFPAYSVRLLSPASTARQAPKQVARK